MEIYVSLSDSKLNVLKNLKPDSVITLFHGASFGVALDMCHNGIDGRRKLYRHYPHYTTNAKGERIMVDRGVFCTHDLKVAKTFGQVCLKFKTVAKNILNIFPSPDVTREARKTWKEFYPGSFRPEVSFNFIRDSEKQGLFVGTARPNQIERVYVYDNQTYKWSSLTREQFIEQYAKKAKFEIKDLTMSDLKDASFDTLVRMMQRDYPSLTEADVLEDVIYRMDNVKTFEAQIAVLENWATYPVAKKICVDMRARGLLPKLPSSRTTTKYSGM